MGTKKTQEEQAVVIAVTQHLINMLDNDIISGYGTESFEGWCEDGAIFEDDEDGKCKELMHKIAPLVDELTYKYLNLGY